MNDNYANLLLESLEILSPAAVKLFHVICGEHFYAAAYYDVIKMPLTYTRSIKVLLMKAFLMETIHWRARGDDNERTNVRNGP